MISSLVLPWLVLSYWLLDIANTSSQQGSHTYKQLTQANPHPTQQKHFTSYSSMWFKWETYIRQRSYIGSFLNQILNNLQMTELTSDMQWCQTLLFLIEQCKPIFTLNKIILFQPSMCFQYLHVFHSTNIVISSIYYVHKHNELV